MSDSENVSIQIPVDLTNPGQFFACCGLLELADRLWPGAEGWFDSHIFTIVAQDKGCSIKALIDQLRICDVVQLDPNNNSASPLLLSAFKSLRLDWWIKVEIASKRVVDVGTTKSLMTWSGSQRGPRIFHLFQQSLTQLNLADPFNHAMAVCDSNASKPDKAISPFYFDARREGMSLDIGFSPDEQDMSVNSYPIVEILALIGIQRFRPAIDDGTRPRSFIYTAWADRLSATVAAFAAQGILNIRAVGNYRFTKPSRGGEYLSMFSVAKRERANHD